MSAYTEEQLNQLPVVPLHILVDNTEKVVEKLSPQEAVAYAHVLLHCGMSQIENVDLRFFCEDHESLGFHVQTTLQNASLI
jgi:hypothetical protein